MSTYLGIDIGNTAVKVAAIRTSYRKVQLVGLTAVEIVQAGDVATAVRNAVQMVVGVAGTFDGVATSIEGTKSTVRILPLPASAHKALGDVLPFELESALPFDIADAVFDYRVLSGARETKGEELSVLVGVAKTADVLSRIELVKAAAGMEPERVGLGAFPIANLIAYQPTLAEGVVALVDLGEAASDVIILKAGEPIFARTLGVGTRGLPASASKLARELRTTFASHRSQGGESPSRVLLCGGGAYTTGVEPFLSSAVETPVEVLPAPVLEAVNIAPEQGALIARFAKAIGLALSLTPRAVSLNLRKGPLAFERGFAWVRERIPLLAGLAAVILVSFLFSVWAQLYAKSKEKAVLEASLGNVTKEVLGESTPEAERANELLSQQTALSDEDPLPHADAFDVMVKLSEAIPQSMTHDIEELDIQKNHVIVHGVVGSVADAQAVRQTLANEKCFSDPKITRTTAQVGGTAQKYVLEFDLKCPEDVKGGKKTSSTAAAAPASAAASAPGGK